MKKLFTLMFFISLTIWNTNLFCQEDPVNYKKQKENNVVPTTEKLEEVKTVDKNSETNVENITLSPDGVNNVLGETDGASPSKAPDIKTFALDPNQVGALANSVNLFTGQVNLPINLISMRGRNGLDVNVSISYSSNVKNIVDTWNLEAPTGVLGLGWQFGYSQIVVDHKGTGTREDDEFYLIDGGSSNKLICYEINTSLGYRKYKTKNYQFWDIKYYTSATDERWEIIKEDGIKNIYGGDLTSTRHTVQYSSKWGNWIGNSNNSTGVSSIVVAWNLSKVKNVWGEEITFNYDVSEITLGSSKQTEACYLKKITDNFNRQIEFYYGLKYPTIEHPNDFEFQEPHTEQIFEPDAYQERYETKYLDSIVVKNTNSFRLFSIHFGYDNYGSGNLYKRQLTSITQKNYGWESLPGLTFSYNSTEINSGALKEVSLPLGGKVLYAYKSQTIGNSERNLQITAPTGYNEPRVFIANDYVVITWRAGNHSTGLQNVKVYAYQWLGEWVGGFITDLGGVRHVNNYQDFTISLQQDFFAILTGNSYLFRVDDYTKLRIFSKSEVERGAWNFQEVLSLQGVFQGQLASGNKYAGLLLTKKEHDNYVKDYEAFFTFDGNSWINSTPNSINGLRVLSPTNYSAGTVHNSITGKDNFVLTHDSYSNPDFLKIDYLNEKNEWIQKSHQIYNTNSGDPSYLYSSNSFAVLFGAGQNEYIYWWTDDYENLYYHDLGNYPDYSAVYCVNNSTVSVNRLDLKLAYNMRFNGRYSNDQQCWIGSGELSGDRFSFNDDYLVWKGIENNLGSATLYKKEVNINSNPFTWSDNESVGGSSFTYLVDPQSGINLFTTDDLFYRRNDGVWLDLGKIQPWYSLNLRQVKTGYNYIAYEGITAPNVYISAIKNATMQSYLTLGNQNVYHTPDIDYGPLDKSELVGMNTFLTYNSSIAPNHFRDVTQFTIYHLQDGMISGSQSSYVVSKIEIDDAEPTTTNATTVFYYESPTENNATVDKTGNIPQFNKVTVIPSGSTSDINVHPYGYTVNYFFNELSSSDANRVFPTGTNTNASTNYMLLTGMPYETNVYDNNNVLKSSTKNYWYVYSKDVSTTRCYYTRLLQKDETLDGVTRTSESTYSTKSGLVKTQQTKNYNTAGVEEILKTEYLYAYEIDPYEYFLNQLNILSPLIQSKTFNGSTCIGMSATTLAQFNGVWAPHKSYIRTTAGSTDFDFDSWSETNEPPSTSGWLKTSEITSIDVRGQVKEVKDVDGIYSTTHWDRNGLQVASFSNTQNTNKTLSENFDDLSFSDGQPVNWTGTGGWAINSLGVLSWPTNTESTAPFYSIQQTPTDFIAEFDVRIPVALTTGDWGGFQFRKGTASATPFTSGYTVFLRKNGRVELYNANGGTILGYYQLSGTDVASDWQRIRVVASGAVIQIYVNGTRRINYSGATSFFGNYTSFYAYRSQAQFDNLIIYPDNAYASMTGYDPKFLLPLKGIDAKGNVVKNVFDSFQRKIGTVGPTNIPISTGSTFLSKDRYSTFNTSDPNSSLSTTVHGNFGLYNDFSTHLNNWTAFASPNKSHSRSYWQLLDGKLVHRDTLGGPIDWTVNLFYTDLGTSLTGRVAIEFSVKIDALSTDDGFGIGIGDNVWDLGVNNAPYWGSATWTYFHNNNQLWTLNPSGGQNLANWLTPGQYHRIQIVLDVTTKKADFFVDGKACLSNFDFVKSTTANIRRIAFFNYGRSTAATTWYIDDFMVYQEPSHSMAFTDAVGKTLQTQTEETSSSIICSETLYDVLGRGYVQTMPVRLSGTGKWLGYRPEFITGFNASTGLFDANSEVITAGSIDNYPYSRTVYELSPLSRSIEQGQPGNELRIGNGHTIRNAFSSNGYQQFPINYPTSQGFVTQSINADGVYAWELKDKLGRTIATKTGPVKGSSVGTVNIGLDEFNSPTGTFTPNVSGTATYYFDRWSNKALYIGTTPGGSQILYTETSGSGTFNVTVGTTYYLTIDYLESKKGESNNSDIDKIESVPITTASVAYPNFVTNVDIYPVSTNEYDASGNLVKIYPPNYYNPPEATSDPNGYVITMAYDYNGRLLSKQSADYGTVQYMYDKAGRLRFSMDANGDLTTDNIKYIKYDGLGRVTEEGYIAQNWSILQQYVNTPSWPTTPVTWRKKYTYGLHGVDVFHRGEVTQVQVNNDANTTAEVTETYTYNVLGDVTTVSTTTGGINQAISYTYNYDGQAATVNYGTTTVYYKYDRLGRVSTIGTSSDADYYASYSYANYNGSLYQEKLNNNAVTRTLSYNNHGWLRKIEDSFMSEEMFYHTGGYGGAGYYNGNMAKITFLDKSAPSYFDYDAQFKYDNLGRMLTADHTNNYSRYENYDLGVGLGNEIKFDANGNLLFVREGTTNRNYKYFNSTNLLMNTDGSANTQYIHDANGNITYSTPKFLSLSYDPYFNSTSSVTDDEYYQIGTFLYGADNERALKQYISYDHTFKTFYYRGLSDYPLVEKNYQGSTLVSTTLYIYGPTGLIVVKDGSAFKYILKDHLGSTRMVLNSSNQIDSRYNYAPFGRIMYSSVSTDVAYKFTGQEYDDENGLHNFRARLYDAEIGMFYAYDPASQGFSPFGYAGNNPVMRIDKDGKLAWFVIPAIVGAVTGIINVATHWDKVKENGFWEGLKAFGIGFGAGFAGTASAAATFTALGGSALGGGGFLAGALSAADGYTITSMISIGGNMAAYNDIAPTVGQYLGGLGLSFFAGGLINGINASANGRSFWDGKLLNTTVNDATNVVTKGLQSGLSDPEVAENFLNTTDEDFVHVTNNYGKENILKPGSGLDPGISGYVTKWKYVKDITNPTDFSKVLFRQDLWNSSDILNRFNEGAWILKITAPFRPEYYSPFANIINGVPQWRYSDFINNSYISPIRFLGF